MTGDQNNWLLSKSKGHTSVKMCSIVPKTYHDLNIFYDKSAYNFILGYATSVMKITNGTRAELNTSKDKR